MALGVAADGRSASGPKDDPGTTMIHPHRRRSAPLPPELVSRRSPWTVAAMIEPRALIPKA